MASVTLERSQNLPLGRREPDQDPARSGPSGHEVVVDALVAGDPRLFVTQWVRVLLNDWAMKFVRAEQDMLESYLESSMVWVRGTSSGEHPRQEDWAEECSATAPPKKTRILTAQIVRVSRGLPTAILDGSEEDPE